MPASLGGYRSAPEVDKKSYKKYHTPASAVLNAYVLFQYVLCLIGTALFLNNESKFSIGEKVLISALICVVVVNAGVLFEQRPWARYSEWLRIIVYPLLLAILTFMNYWSFSLYLVAGGYFIISFIWFYATQKKHVYYQVA